MKRTKIFFAAAILALLGVVAAQTASSYENALSFVNLSVSPSPIVAGGNVTIRFQLYNSYISWIYNTNLQPSGSYPLLNVTPQNGYVIGLLNPGMNPKYYNYSLAIPNTTPSGVYTLAFTATYYVLGPSGAVVSTSSMPINFYVQNKPGIKVMLSSPQPSTLYSGYNQTVALLIENIGYGTARNVSVTVSSGQGLNVLSSVDTFFISNLTQGSTVSEPLFVAAQSTGPASLVANITYYSSKLKQRFSSVQTISLSVAPSAQFLVASGNSTLAPGATAVPVTFVLRNDGSSAATQISLSLQSNYPVSPVASTYYINNLPVGGSANVVFLVSIDSRADPGQYPVTLYEQWRQPNGAVNQQFAGSSSYFVMVSSGSSGAGTLGEAALAVVVVAVAAYLLRRRLAAGAKRR